MSNSSTLTPLHTAPIGSRSLLLRYGVALLSVAVAVLLRELLTPLWGSRLPFLTLFPAVMVGAWYGGLGPGIVTTALGALAAVYFWLAPFYSLTVAQTADVVGLALAVLEMLLIAWLAAALRRTQEQLEHRVRERTADLTQANAALQAEISERRRAEEALQRQALLFTHVSDAIVMADFTGHVIEWNPAAERLYGYSHAEIVGQRLDQLFPTAGVLGEVLAMVRETGRFAGEVAIQWKDGSPGIVAAVVVPVLDGHGMPGGVVGVSHDITARKQMEEELRMLNAELDQRVRERTAALAESEGRFRLLADSAPVLIWVNNLKGCEFVNQEYLRFLGVDAEDVRGYDWTPFVHPEDREAYVKRYLDALAQRRRFTTQFRFRRHDGVYRWMHSIGLPRFSGQGECLGYVGSTTDITDLKEAGEALAQHARDLEHLNTDLRQVAYIFAHDLQEPVRQMGIYTQKLAKRYRAALDAETTEAMDFIIEGAKRMRAQFTDLIHYLDVDEQGQGRSTANCEEVLRRALEALHDPITASGATVTHNPLPTLEADAAHLQLVLQELLDNALKFRNSVPPRVHVWAEREEHSWRFAVRDNGIGVDPQGAGQLFGFFRRLHPRQQYPGTGMGLAICKKIVERHGGRMWVESAVGNGATFFFTIAKRSSQ